MILDNFRRQLKSTSPEVRSGAAYILCSVLQQSVAVITIPIFTRLLTVEEYGIGTIYVSVMSFIMIFTSLQLYAGSFPQAMMKFENDRDGYISSLCGITTVLTLGYIAVYFIARAVFDKVIGLPPVLMLLMAGEMLATTVTNFFMGRARFDYAYKPVVRVTILKLVLCTLASLAAVLFLPQPGVWKVGAAAIATTAIGAVIYFRQVFRGKKFFDRTYWKYAITYNLPILTYYLAHMTFNQADRLMVNALISREAAAKYGVAYSLGFVLVFVIHGINNSFVPWMYRRIKEGQLQKMRQVTYMLSMMTAVVLLLVIALAPEILLLMAGRQYVEAAYVVPPVAMSLLLLFYAYIYINLEFYYEERKSLAVNSLIPAILNIVLNFIFIPMYGYVAAAYTTLICHAVFSALNYNAAKGVLFVRNTDIKKLVDRKKLILLFVDFAASGAIMTLLYPSLPIRLVLIACAAAAAFLLRKKWLPVVAELTQAKEETEDESGKI